MSEAFVHMGASGTAIFSDDTASDTRDAFRDYIAEGLTPVEATDRLVAESAEILSDVEESGVFWLALATTQWKLGRLLDSVRDRALQVIDSGTDLHRWQDNPQVAVHRRTQQLARIRSQLLSPQPKPKKLKPRTKSSTDFKTGDVALFRLDRKTAIRFCVLHLWGDRGGTYCDICLLGLDDGKPFGKRSLRLTDTLGPHYTMVSHEPAGPVILLRRGVRPPKRTAEAFRA